MAQKGFSQTILPEYSAKVFDVDMGKGLDKLKYILAQKRRIRKLNRRKKMRRNGVTMEIERKYTIKELPGNLDSYEAHHIEQAYLNTEPVIRIRKEDEEYYLTYKGKGLLAREEYNLPLNAASYYHLRKKADGNVISKTRYLIPLEKPEFSVTLSAEELNVPLKVELDIFDEPFRPLIIAEVEFPTENAANAFLPPSWLEKDVTFDYHYHNSYLSQPRK